MVAPAQSVSDRVRRFYAANSPHFLDDEAEIRSGAAEMSIHRHVLDPQSGAYSPHVVNEGIFEFLRPRLPVDRVPRVLDAGCGWGGTLFYLAERMALNGVGMTLCPIQRDRAAMIAQHQGRESLDFIEGDFCAGVPGDPYDAIIAVESIAHTTNYARSLALLAAHLAPGGALVVVDDFLSGSAPPDPALLALFQAGWIVEAVETVEGVNAALALDGLALHPVTDYSPRVFRRPPETCTALLDGITPEALTATADDRARARLGGVALEQLYNRGEMRYLMASLSRGGA